MTDHISALELEALRNELDAEDRRLTELIELAYGGKGERRALTYLAMIAMVVGGVGIAGVLYEGLSYYLAGMIAVGACGIAYLQKVEKDVSYYRTEVDRLRPAVELMREELKKAQRASGA
ncbi:hypothetical protein PSm6_00260 [Pseudomonas solani]|uniref:DUF3040 domain-containing protein n=1 Tax=Pseudomonas solani TaxID=2731552 RepID=A0ABM7L273_9PSED|nr:hypothetical protein [Pseudomonas solani]BCD83619.1 hypothetical protein PSm6_00260 [Pseudomonas solani]